MCTSEVHKTKHYYTLEYSSIIVKKLGPLRVDAFVSYGVWFLLFFGIIVV